ncbi:3D domain-containing protein [Enterocloster clostridioformis]
MRRQEYHARDKTVKKMSRDGLTEEKLNSGVSIRISQREVEKRVLQKQAEDTFSLGSAREPGEKTAMKKRRKRQRYIANTEEKGAFCGEEKQDTSLFAEEAKNSPFPETSKAESPVPPGTNGEGEEEEKRAENFSRGITEHSLRSRNIRGHPAGRKSYEEAAEEVSHARKKKIVQDYAQKGKEKPENTAAMEDSREEAKPQTKREQFKKEQKTKRRLSFGDENDGMVRGAGMGISKRAISSAVDSADAYVHGKVREAEQENAAVEASHRTEQMAEKALRYAMRRTNRGLHKRRSRIQEEKTWRKEGSRLVYETAQGAGETAAAGAVKNAEQTKQGALRKFWQKRQYQKAYRAAKQGETATAGTAKAAQTFFTKAKSVLSSFLGKSRGLLGILAVGILFFAIISALFASCGASLQGGAAATLVSTTYASTDEDIYAVENAYAALEEALNAQINSMESRHPGYDEYRYQIDEISHNPYHLISYFTAKYGEFTYEQVAGELEEIFRLQYGISTESTKETVTETKKVRVGESLGQVVTSGYCSCSICCGQWAGGPTASGVYPTANHTIAVDASSPFVPIGTRVIMNGTEYVVEDTGTFARYGVQFDVYYGDHASASSHGHQTWEAYLADDNGNQEVEVTTTSEVNRLDVTLTNHGLDAVLRALMDEKEEGRYDLYNATYGNRDYLFDTDTLPGNSGEFGYEIPAEALTDEKFANMIHEAEKYLGYPYGATCSQLKRLGTCPMIGGEKKDR